MTWYTSDVCPYCGKPHPLYFDYDLEPDTTMEIFFKCENREVSLKDRPLRWRKDKLMTDRVFLGCYLKN